MTTTLNERHAQTGHPHCARTAARSMRRANRATPKRPGVRLRCSEIWGGIADNDQDLCTAGITASLYSSAADGRRGGDIYYFSVCDSDRLTRIALADVMGHGETVSALSGALYDSLAARMNTLEGDGVLRDLNDFALAQGFHAITTAAVIAYYKSDGNLYASSAGHHPLLLLRKGEHLWRPIPSITHDGFAATGSDECRGVADGAIGDRTSSQLDHPVILGKAKDPSSSPQSAIRDPQSNTDSSTAFASALPSRAKRHHTDLPLGVLPDVAYTQQSTPLRPGDRLFLYTDGLIEAPDENGDLFTAERLIDTLNDSAAADLLTLKQRVLARLRDHTRGPLTHDDVTLMAIEVH